ncbi:MAG TPA: hypothetical protein VNB64_04975 [Solirubrobacteraceae bacterium]|nr:hypothetical protein [Solirubrobacteraceae bacterium]
MSSEEEQLRAQLEEEMKRITVDDLLVQSVVSLVNLAGRKAGLAPGTEDERNLPQVKTAIDAVSALLPLLERENAEAVRPIRDALAQLQMAYARESQGETGEAPPTEPAPPQRKPGDSGLWVPGQ